MLNDMRESKVRSYEHHRRTAGMIAGDVAVLVFEDLAGHVREAVPNALAGAIASGEPSI